MSQPPEIYYSPFAYGRFMRLPVPEVPIYTVQEKPSPDIPISYKIYTYRFSHVEENHQWESRELRVDYRARLEREWEENGKLNPNFHRWVMEHDGYPEMASTIVRIGPAWVYRLVGEE